MNNKEYDIETIKMKHRCGCTMYVKTKKEVTTLDMLKQCDDLCKIIPEQNYFYCIGCGKEIFTLENVFKVLMIKE